MEVLPDELCNSIISYLDDADLEPLSLVSKQFLSITNSLNQTLNLSHESTSTPFLPSLLRRFSSIKRISLSDSDSHSHSLNPSDVLLKLADFYIRLETLNLSGLSRLPLEALHRLPPSLLNGIKCLDISGIRELCDDDLNTIPLLFPALEDLDLSIPVGHCSYNFGYKISDHGIQLLIPKLNPCLKKINLCGHRYLLRYVILLSQYCTDLEEIVMHGSLYMNQIAVVISSFKKLKSIVCRGVPFSDWFRDPDLPLCLETPSLSKIEFDSFFVSGHVLLDITKPNSPLAHSPLKSITLANTSSMSFRDVLSFMNTYDSLDYFEIKRTLYTDGELAILAKHLTNAKVVKFTACPNLSLLTLFTFIWHCPLLHTFEMNCDDTLGEKPDDFVGGNYIFDSRIRTLKVSRNWRLVSMIALVYPSLERLELEKCQGISSDDLEEIMGKCPNLKHLIIDGCCKVSNRFQDSET